MKDKRTYFNFGILQTDLFFLLPSIVYTLALTFSDLKKITDMYYSFIRYLILIIVIYGVFMVGIFPHRLRYVFAWIIFLIASLLIMTNYFKTNYVDEESDEQLMKMNEDALDPSNYQPSNLNETKKMR